MPQIYREDEGFKLLEVSSGEPFRENADIEAQIPCVSEDEICYYVDLQPLPGESFTWACSISEQDVPRIFCPELRLP